MCVCVCVSLCVAVYERERNCVSFYVHMCIHTPVCVREGSSFNFAEKAEAKGGRLLSSQGGRNEQRKAETLSFAQGKGLGRETELA